MARVYADVNQNMPRSYWDYDSVNISKCSAISAHLNLPLVQLSLSANPRLVLIDGSYPTIDNLSAYPRK